MSDLISLLSHQNWVSHCQINLMQRISLCATQTWCFQAQNMVPLGDAKKCTLVTLARLHVNNLSRCKIFWNKSQPHFSKVLLFSRLCDMFGCRISLGFCSDFAWCCWAPVTLVLCKNAHHLISPTWLVFWARKCKNGFFCVCCFHWSRKNLLVWLFVKIAAVQSVTNPTFF